MICLSVLHIWQLMLVISWYPSWACLLEHMHVAASYGMGVHTARQPQTSFVAVECSDHKYPEEKPGESCIPFLDLALEVHSINSRPVNIQG